MAEVAARAEWRVKFRLVILAASVIFGFLLTGVIFGWPSMNEMLLNEGVYSDLCEEPVPVFTNGTQSGVEGETEGEGEGEREDLRWTGKLAEAKWMRKRGVDDVFSVTGRQEVGGDFSASLLAFWQLLDGDDTDESATIEESDDNEEEDGPCGAQKSRIQLVFTSCIIVLSFTTLPAGLILDKMGPRISIVISCSVMLVGVALVSLAASGLTGGGGGGMSSVFTDLYFYGFTTISGSAVLLYLAMFNVSALFPGHEGLTLSLINSAFDASAVVFYFMYLAYVYLTMSISLLFALYMLAPLSLILLCWLWPVKSFQHQEHTGDQEELLEEAEEDLDVTHVEMVELEVGASPERAGEEAAESGEKQRKKDELDGDMDLLQADIDYDEELAGEKEDGEQQAAVPAGVGHVTFMRKFSLKQQLLTPEYLGTVVFYSFSSLCINFFYGTANGQYVALDPSETQLQLILSVFALLQPIGSVVSAVTMGSIIDRAGLIPAICTIHSVNLLFQFTNLIPIWSVKYFSTCVISFYRPAMYATMASYVTLTFGFANFGALWGIMVLLSAAAQALQYPMLLLVLYVFDGSFTGINFVIFLTSIVMSFYPALLYWRKLQHKKTAAA